MSEAPNKFFIFDANFMICLKQTNSSGAYSRLLEAKKKIGIEFATSSRVFQECPFLNGKLSASFREAVSVTEVLENELNNIKSELSKRGVKLVAQDPDLTLVALAEKTQRSGKEVYIVSDDYKLSENVRVLQKYKIKFLSLPAFLQYLHQHLSGELKEYFGRVRKLVLRNNLDFMMSRHEQFPAQEKIVWLIENAVTVAGEGISITGSCSSDDLEDVGRYFQIMEDYLQDKKIDASEKENLESFIPTLDKVKGVREHIKRAKTYLQKDETLDALKFLRRSLSVLREIIQISGSELKKTQFDIILRILASEYCKIDFLYAFTMIGQNKVPQAIDALNETAMFATIAGLKETILSINYLKALVNIFNKEYEKAIKQYNFTEQLSGNYKNSLLQLKCRLGAAISMFLKGDKEDSNKMMQELALNDDNKEKKKDMLVAMAEMGDFFYALGLPEIAYLLYSESLELAVDLSEFSWMINILVEKMKKTNIASALLGYVARPSTGINAILDHAYKVENVDRFNEELVKIAMFNQLFYEPFEFYTQVEDDGKAKPATKKKKASAKKTTKQSKTKKGKSESDVPLAMTSQEVDLSDLTAEELEMMGISPKKKWISEWALYSAIDNTLKESFKVLKFQEDYRTGHTIIIAYSEKIGIIAFDVALPTVLSGNAESYTLELKSKAKVKVERPDDILRDMFLIRAIVRIEDESQVDLKRGIPIFFSQMKI